MGWRIPWVSSAPGDFNFDLGFSHTPEEGREVVEQMAKGGLPPIVEHNARASRHRCRRLHDREPRVQHVRAEDGAVYQAYSTTWRGLEFLMSYYPILDHAPKGRDEGEAWQLWIRRHDEY